MEFEWDAEKARMNVIKHGVDFATAIRVFDDPHNLVEFDDGPHDEERWQVTGLSGHRILIVIHTDPDDGVVRIISDREASKHEQNRYYREARP